MSLSVVVGSGICPNAAASSAAAPSLMPVTALAPMAMFPVMVPPASPRNRASRLASGEPSETTYQIAPAALYCSTTPCPTRLSAKVVAPPAALNTSAPPRVTVATCPPAVPMSLTAICVLSAGAPGKVITHVFAVPFTTTRSPAAAV